MAKIGLVGPSYVQRSTPFDAQRSVNLFPVMDQYGKEVASMYGRPGLNLLGVVGTGPGRGAFYAPGVGRAFVVSGNGLYEVFADGTSNLLGSLDQSNGIVTMDENGFQLAVCDQNSLYIFTYATNAFAKVVNVNLPSAASVTFIDGFFVVNRVNSGIFQISNIYDGTQWQALNFATAESSPDNLLRVLNVNGQLWLFGSITTEIWSNNGGALFPYTRIAGAKTDTGIGAAFTAITVDNSVFWVGQNKNGFGVVYRAQGFSPVVKSTDTISIRLQAAPNPTTLRANSYQEDNHEFVMITGGGMTTDLVYDLTTDQWHERASLDQFGNFQLQYGAAYMFAFNETFVIDNTNGNLYQQKMGLYTDNGTQIPFERTYTHINQESQRFTINNLTIGFETGVGDVANDIPLVTMYLSRDGGRTWLDGVTKSIGQIGHYLHRVVFWRLGLARQLTIRIRITSNVKTCITGSYVNTVD